MNQQGNIFQSILCTYASIYGYNTNDMGGLIFLLLAPMSAVLGLIVYMVARKRKASKSNAAALAVGAFLVGPFIYKGGMSIINQIRANRLPSTPTMQISLATS